VAEALEALGALRDISHPDEDRLHALADRADRCRIHAAAYVAWLEDRCARSQGPMGWRAALFQVYIRIGLARNAVELAKAFPGLATALGTDPRRYLARHARAGVFWGRSAWEDNLVGDFRGFLRQLDAH
jgi:hypothetical protein